MLLVTDVAWAGLLVVQIALGVAANRLYLRHGLATINKLREAVPDRPAYLERLRKKGNKLSSVSGRCDDPRLRICPKPVRRPVAGY